uniref:Uncharacterized protein n=1 Tax=Strombidium inclinatum TaxID=197538 RepID=A0A7S3MX36_9SPIT|mmetsp:Transcript_24786/g.38580  ORF Transcript_24786/g.38580 Transcript_24786/m.38580 type:complete len:442 (+) Transcript_24786:382-1707(+)
MEMARDNEIHFVEGYQSPTGPIKYMTQAAKDKVHAEIDERMQEMEDTGLTRYEILFEKQRGMPLADDPVFQYVKNQRVAREMIVRPGEEFTADRVIELALRQDFGPDPSITMSQRNWQLDDKEDGEQPNWEYKKKYRDNTPILKPEAYYAGHNQVQRRKELFEFDTEKPATFINRPLSRDQLRKKVKRRLTKSEIDYRDTAMMTKFLNDAGKLYNRYQTRLDTNVQRKIAKTVKKMRHQFILPWVGMIKPTDKIPLGSMLEDLEEMHKKTIDPVTGKLFLKHSLQDELKAKLEKERIRLEKRFGHIETNTQFEPIKQQADEELNFIREMSIDSGKVMPNQMIRNWNIAQSHILFNEAQNEEEDPEARLFKDPTELDLSRAETAYKTITQKLSSTRHLNSDNLFGDLLSEKAFELEKLLHPQEKSLQEDLLDYARSSSEGAR